MSEFITLSCPNCGGKLGISEDFHRFTCTYCGTEHIFKRAPRIFTNEPIVQGQVNIQRGADSMAAEMAIRRLRDEIESENRRFHTLARKLLDIDYVGTVDLLQEVGKNSIFRYIKLAGIPDDVTPLEEIIVSMSAMDTEDFAERYMKSKTRISSKKVKECESLLNDIRDIKANIMTLEARIKKYEESLI